MINTLEPLEDINIEAEQPDQHETYSNKCINACFEAIDRR